MNAVSYIETRGLTVIKSSDDSILRSRKCTHVETGAGRLRVGGCDDGRARLMTSGYLCLRSSKSYLELGSRPGTARPRSTAAPDAHTALEHACNTYAIFCTIITLIPFLSLDLTFRLF